MRALKKTALKIEVTKVGWIRNDEKSDGKCEKEGGPGWLLSFSSSVYGDYGYHMPSWEYRRRSFR